MKIKRRKRTHLEILASSSDSDVEILDNKPEEARVRAVEHVPVLEDLANDEVQPIPDVYRVQNIPVEREEASLLTTPNGSSSSDDEIIDINDDESEDAVDDEVFHDDNQNVNEDNSAIVISDSDSGPVSDEVIPKERFRRRISPDDPNLLILSADISCGIESTPIRAVMDREAAETVLLENSDLTREEIMLQYSDMEDLFRIAIENTHDLPLEEQNEIDQERKQLNCNSKLRDIQGSYGTAYISLQYETDLSKLRQNEIDHFPEEAKICCSCTDGCVTRKCECKKVTWKDNRHFLDMQNKTSKLLKPPKDLSNFPYRNGKLLDPIVPKSNAEKAFLGTDIPYECNDKCSCQRRENKKKTPCTNHVVQDGLKVQIEMFLTKRKGWGIRALQDIPKGTFMGAYIGEIRHHENNPGQELKARKFNHRYVLQMDSVTSIQNKLKDWALENPRNEVPNVEKLAIITNQTPQNIHDIMDREGLELDMMALHWLPENSSEFDRKSDKEQKKIQEDYSYVVNSYVYDSANHGSFCRLFNHRCDDGKGSMVKWQYVHTVRQDQRIPTIAFFAQRDIKKGEEITWDYRLETTDKEVAERHLCHCESPQCRKYFIHCHTKTAQHFHLQFHLCY